MLCATIIDQQCCFIMLDFEIHYATAGAITDLHSYLANTLTECCIEWSCRGICSCTFMVPHRNLELCTIIINLPLKEGCTRQSIDATLTQNNKL